MYDFEAVNFPESHDTESSDIARVWPSYFPDVELADDDRRLKLVRELCIFLLTKEGDYLLSLVKRDDGILYLPLDFHQLQRSCNVEEFYAALEVAPKEALLSMGAAVHKVLLSRGKNQLENEEKINIRLHSHPASMIALKNLKSAYIGRLVSVRGTVVKVSTVRPLVVRMSFACGKCGTVIPRVFPDGKYSPPMVCNSHGCKSRTFFPIRSTAQPIDFQKIRVQELQRSEFHEEGRMPRTVECELTEDLVDACIPGDVVTVCGIIKVINTYMDVGGGKSKSKNQGLYYLYLEAVSIRNSKSQSAAEDLQVTNVDFRAGLLTDLYAFSPRDLEFIVRFSEEHGSNIFCQLLHSICPSIYGHELVKAGITLALFGGVQKNLMDQNKVPVRGDVHVIIVGDPGLGKSQLLQAAVAVAPRGIYVCGNATTNAGLTVAVVKDPLTSDYAFEAGAMVLADRGLCCIDEFDKLSAEHQALLEAMEQQCVSVAKAGMVASLSARTSVLAAANPVGGHYDRAKTVNENLKMSATLLSRFDLVFILLDKPDELLDKRVSEHIMALHAGYAECFQAPKKLRNEIQNNGVIEMGVRSGSLVSRLRLDPVNDKDFVPLPSPLLRKYIAYARSFVFPRMSKVAAEILQKFYLQLRNHNSVADGTPITARQLESLVRLAEARARLDLREEITGQDALDVVEIMKESLYDKFVDEHGFVDFGRSGGMSQQKEAKRFLAALQKQSELHKKDCFSVSEIYSLADKIGLRVPDMDVFIENLNSNGYLLKKGPKTYQVLSSSYSKTQGSSQITRSRG
ncbi:probable DNA helicase MCM8 isoform X2 [Amborella trichopoda]|uniref:probable DNA helicase MCM8 isoform X2 n=1 Tax=Amborella trichopoda TaxID=13333 RepID=UPI0009BFE194|nr:probable DNA helicase MCM8 isoform X2 [Amborella trichopoda]|eukprot:XP_020522186.1 probable DNA helicase MCM8 isoform X2 [Amborella trichopoda]